MTGRYPWDHARNARKLSRPPEDEHWVWIVLGIVLPLATLFLWWTITD